MGQIFSAACRTVVWLGEDKNGMEAAMNYVERIRSSGQMHLSSEDTTKIIAPIFQSQWFHRLWVVQEVALAEHVEFAIGRRTFRMDTLWQALPREFFQHQYLFDIRAVVNLQQIDHIRQTVRQGRTSTERHNILELIRLTEWFEVTNKKDRLYALYGLTGAIDFAIDYRPCYSHQEMFVDFAAWSLRKFPDLALLSYTRGAVGKCLCTGPSWAPCYDMEGPPISLLKVRHFKAFGLPAKRTHSFSPGVFEIHEKRNLRLSGSFIDTVREVCPAALNCAKPEQQLQSLRAAMGLAKCSDCSGERYRKFCAALVLELDYNNRRAAGDFINLVDQYVRGEWSSTEQVSAVMSWWPRYRRLCTTTDDRLAWVPWKAKPEDRICIFQGGRIPYTVRPRSDGTGTYSLLGECWVQGLMEGEALRLPRFNMENIVLA